MIRFIAEHKDLQVAGPGGGAGLRWGVEPMCAVLSEHGVPISPSTYYDWIAKTPTRRQILDCELVEIITAAREDKKTGKFVKTLGSRKLWIWLRGQGHDVARCTVERIMGENGWEGARYGSKQERAHPPARSLARRQPGRDRHRRVGGVVQHRTPSRIPRRLHPRSRREAPLRSQTHPSSGGVIQRKQSPDSPGRVRGLDRAGSSATLIVASNAR